MKKTVIFMLSMLLALCLFSCGSQNRTFTDCGVYKFTATKTVLNIVQKEEYNSTKGRNVTTLSKTTYAVYISKDEKYKFYLRISDAKNFTKGASKKIRVLKDSDTGELFYINADVPEKDYNEEALETMQDRVTELPE